MMQKGMIVICGDAADGVADSMYAGTIYVGGGIGELGADAVEAEIDPGEHSTLLALLERWQVPAPAGLRKLVSGRKLWNFERALLHIWKEAL
jgi:glutamate synthase domain-containing protein 3